MQREYSSHWGAQLDVGMCATPRQAWVWIALRWKEGKRHWNVTRIGSGRTWNPQQQENMARYKMAKIVEEQHFGPNERRLAW